MFEQEWVQIKIVVVVVVVVEFAPVEAKTGYCLVSKINNRYYYDYYIIYRGPYMQCTNIFLQCTTYISQCTNVFLSVHWKKYLALHIWATVIISKKMFLKNCGNKSIKSHFPIFSELSLSWWCFFTFEDTLFALVNGKPRKNLPQTLRLSVIA